MNPSEPSGAPTPDPTLTVRDLLLARAVSGALALRTDGVELSWTDYVAAARGRAADLDALLPPEGPRHVGMLSLNSAEFAIQLAAAGLGGHVLVGMNTTRRGAGLLADLHRADVSVLIVDAACRPLLADLDLAGVTVLDAAQQWSLDGPEPTTVPNPDDLFMLIFTSGTSGDPKAVRMTHAKIATPAQHLVNRLALTDADVHYISMPMFHSNAVIAGWSPILVTGGSMSIAPRFSASGFLDDVRRFGATYANYVGKPLAYILATPERPDDADNPLRVVFGNEAAELDTARFANRFDCRVIDGFGSTENAVVVSRIDGTPSGALGWPAPGVAVFDPETDAECPRAQFDATGTLVNAEECVGELVNTTGGGQFAGYYNDPDATEARLRGGRYWSGDLAYRDEAGWIYFVGRTSDWLRVDGENLATGPIERILLRHPAIADVAVYGIPDPAVGDRVAAAIVLSGPLDAAGFSAFLDAQEDLGTKSRPMVVHVLDALPQTATTKVLKRELQRLGAENATWHRVDRATEYRVVSGSTHDATARGRLVPRS